MHAITLSVLPGDIVFDVGANEGDKSEWYASRQVRVVAVEPQPLLAKKLRERFATSPLVTVLEKGVADKPGILQMSICDNHVLSTFADEWKEGRFADQRWSASVEVHVTTLDALIDLYGIPRYMKIDVEGFEMQVLMGLSRKAGSLSFEFTSEFFDTAVDICLRLESLGYTCFNFSLGESVDFATDWLDRIDIISKLRKSIEQNSMLWGDIYAN